MDLDDSFTEGLLARSKARKEYLKRKKMEVGKRRTPLIEEQQVPCHGNGTSRESPKRLCVEQEMGKNICMEGEVNENVSIEEEIKENISMEEEVTENVFEEKEKEVSFMARGLAALRKKESSQGMTNEKKVCKDSLEVNKPATYFFSTNATDICTTRKTRLANLAANINSWEDDLQRPNDTYQSKPLTTNTSSINTKSHPIVCEKGGNSTGHKGQIWNQAVQAALNLEPPKVLKNAGIVEKESQKAVKSLGMVGKEPQKVVKNIGMLGKEEGRDKPPPKKEEILKPTFKAKQTDINLDRSFDPSDLPLAARKALFEKALVGERMQLNTGTFEPKLSVAQRAAMFENASKNCSGPRKAVTSGNGSPVKSSVAAKQNFMSASKSPAQKEKSTVIPKQSPVQKFIASPAKLPLSPSKPFIQPQSIQPNANNTESKREISSLVSHWEKLSSSSSITNSQSEGEQQPCDSENESYISERDLNESECEKQIETESENRDETNSMLEDEYPEESEEEDPFVEPATFDPKRFSAEAGLDTYSQFTTDDEAQSNVAESIKSSVSESIKSSVSESIKSSVSESIKSSVSESIKSSVSESIKSSVSEGSSYYPSKSQTCSSSSCETEDGGERPHTPLQYTVSFYRKQKQETRKPPSHTIVRRELIPPVEEEDLRTHIQENIKRLQEEVVRQQTVIGQTSQALTLCHATAEFYGSSEQVEGERLLLIATQKRQACLNEIQRLKSHGAQGNGAENGTGKLTVANIELPLKRDFIAAQLEGKTNDVVHYFLCLLRHGHQVIVTQMVSTNDKISNGSLCFTNLIQLQDLPSDFSIVFEVYALQTKNEHIPHEKKYHIRKEHSKIRLTPKGKKNDGKIPAMSSPGGPHAVRSPSFGVVGYTRFTLNNCSKKCFTLDKVPFSSPLEGILKVRLQLHAEHKVTEKGFLTMFEDVSGLGAWHRRWCVLDAHHLAYWKYPDDESRKDAMGAIDLRQCVTEEVRLVPRDVCARPHTFQLVEVRPRKEGDRNTLISQSQSTLTTTRRLLSADTREERERWCQQLNEALHNIRQWDPSALAPAHR